MTAPIAISIGGSAVANSLQDSITISAYRGRTISTINATLYDKGNALAIPQEGVDIVITRPDTGDRIFGGLTSMITGWTEGGAATGRYWQIQGQSYTVLLDRILFFRSFQPNFTYSGQVGDIAILKSLFETGVVGAWGATGGTSEIIVDPAYCQQGLKALSAYNAYYITAREAVEYLANLVGYDYYVDENLYLHYYFQQQTPGPFGLSSSPNGTTTIGCHGLRYKRDGTRLQNNTLVYGAAFKSDTQTKIFTMNGSDVTLSIVVNGQNNPVLAPPGSTYISVWKNTGSDVTPSWTTLTVGISGVDTTATKQVIWDVDKQQLTFAVAPPNLTNSVKIQYAFSYTGGRTQTATDSVTNYNRVFSSKLVASDANSIAAVESKLKNLQTQYKSALVSLSCEVDDTDFPIGNTNRFKVGQYITCVNSSLGVNSSYWVHSITTMILGGTIRKYQLELRNYVLG